MENERDPVFAFECQQLWCIIRGMNKKCPVCNTKFIAKKKKQRFCGYQCSNQFVAGQNVKNPIWRTKVANHMSRENNPNWNNDVGYNGLHNWVRQHKLKPELCESCGLVSPHDLANISHTPNPETYTRDLGNWEYLCRKCHMKKDGRLNKLIQRNKNHGKSQPAQ